MNMQVETGDRREIYTIGHTTLTETAFVDLLRKFDITMLVDIRRYPGSRHAPRFNPEALRQALTAAGIHYVLLPELGGRRQSSPDSLNTTWRNASFRGYADYMETVEFRDALTELIDLAATQRVAIMCAEAVWWRCHRSMVADALTASGWQVWHIMSGGTLKPHHLTAPARLVDGELTYRPETPPADEVSG